MDVIINTTDRMRLHAVLNADLPEDIPHSLLDAFIDKPLAILCREDNVVEQEVA